MESKLLQEEYSRVKREVRKLREEVQELRKYRHNIEFLIHPFVEQIWLDGYQSENRTFQEYKEKFLSAKRKSRIKE
jgi:hypothetical protein